MGSKTCLGQTLCDLIEFLFIAERCTRRELTLMADTGKGAQAWHVEHQSSDKETVAHL